MRQKVERRQNQFRVSSILLIIPEPQPCTVRLDWTKILQHSLSSNTKTFGMIP